MELPKHLKDEVCDYCRANDITDIDGFVVKLVQSAFTIEKFGYAPNSGAPAKPIEVEVVKEVVEVEKIVRVTDDVETEKLIYRLEDSESMRLAGAKIYQKDRDELNTKIVELTKTIAEQTEQIDKMSKSDDRDIYGEKRTRGSFCSNLLDN